MTGTGGRSRGGGRGTSEGRTFHVMRSTVRRDCPRSNLGKQVNGCCRISHYVQVVLSKRGYWKHGSLHSQKRKPD